MGGIIRLTSTDKVKYPFLPQAKNHVANLGVDVADLASLPGVVDRSKERITVTFQFQVNTGEQKPHIRSETEIASFPVANLVVTGVNDNTLIERYALSEAKKAYNYLLGEKEEIILGIAEYFKWDINHSKRPPFSYTLHFVNYLNNATKGRLTHNSKWKLINRQVKDGKVSITRNEVCRLLQEEIKKHIEDNIRALIDEKITKRLQSIQTIIDEIKAEYIKIKPHLSDFDPMVKAEESDYPPCIKHLLFRTAKAQHLSHVERFALVTYLIHQGISINEIINMFSNVADFREDLTRYQVEHLAGQKSGRTEPYKTQNCSTLQTHGVCFNPDKICETIRNPLTYHLRKKSREDSKPKSQIETSTEGTTKKPQHLRSIQSKNMR